MIVVVVCFSHDIASSSSSKSFKCRRRLLFFCSLKVFEEKCRTFFCSPPFKGKLQKKKKKKKAI